MRDDSGAEHAVLSDGWRHLRIDVAAGTLAAGPVILHYELAGLASLAPKILSLRRLTALCGRRRFPVRLFPPDRRVARWLEALRVHDAVRAGATQREIAAVLFGADCVGDNWRVADSWRSRVRRLVREAHRLGSGGYWSIMRDRRRTPRVADDRRPDEP